MPNFWLSSGESTQASIGISSQPNQLPPEAEPTIT
jgi:hypothetical protein